MCSFGTPLCKIKYSYLIQIICKQNYFTFRWDPNRCCHFEPGSHGNERVRTFNTSSQLSSYPIKSVLLNNLFRVVNIRKHPRLCYIIFLKNLSIHICLNKTQLPSRLVGGGCRIHRLHLCWGVRQPHSTSVLIWF